MAAAGAVILVHEVNSEKTTMPPEKSELANPRMCLKITSVEDITSLDYTRNNHFLSCRSHCYFLSFMG